MELTNDVAKRLKSLIEPYVEAEDTCDDIKEHLNHNNTSGNYLPLAKYFQNKGANEDSIDECYKMWLSNLIDEGKENESIVLSCLKEKYTTQDALRNFVFLTNSTEPELNQKWHYFISYWGLKEFVTRNPNKNYKNITPLNQNPRYIHNGYIRCKELKLWCGKFGPNKQK